MIFDGLNPSGTSCYLIKVKHLGVENLIKIHIAIVAFYNLSLRLEGMDNLLDAVEFWQTDICCFVDEHEVAKLNLLNEQILDIIVSNGVFNKVFSIAKLVTHAHSIHNGHDAIEFGDTIFYVLWRERWHRADGLRDRSRFANTAGFDYDIIKALHGEQLVELLHKIHLQSATNTAVLQGNEAVIFLIYNAALLNEFGVDIHFSNIVYYHCKTNTFLVG